MEDDNELELKEIVHCVWTDWIDLAEGRDRWQATVNSNECSASMKIRRIS
jgi:hypothetical protein